MMKRLLVAILLIGGLALGGCSSNPPQDGVVHPEKAAEINAQLGLRYMMQGNYERAMEKLKRSLSYEPDYGPAHHYMGELYRRLGRPKDAEKNFRKALDEMPNDSALLNNYGVFLCGQGRFDDAEKHFLGVLKNPVYQPRAQVYENLGLCLRDKPDLVKAEKYLRQGLILDPKMPNSLLAMAEICFETHRLMSARGYLERFQQVARPTPESLWLGIRVERILGDQDALASYGLMLKNTYPDSDQARLYRESSSQ